PPEVVSPVISTTIFAESDNAKALSITCRDIDFTVARFGLVQVRLLNQSHPELGTVYLAPDGQCTNGAAVDFTSSQPTIPLTTLGGSSAVNTTTLCYKANKSTKNATIVGTDRVFFQCEDRVGATAVSYTDVNIKNVLISGCTDQSNHIGLKCRTVGME